MALAFSLIAQSAVADYRSGLAAYMRNDFATAIAEWTPVATQG
ncbi:MAG: sel1 repeat family protein, partial [Gammaproteobacteria bacterium HGW-Gammaproteobacteria-7]